MIGTDEGEFLLGNEGADDTFFGGAGSDYMKGDIGSDMMSGGSEDDTMLGGEGADDVSGDAGNDRLDGNAGRDTMDSGTGDHFVASGGSDDILSGDTGADTFLFRQDDVGSPPDTDIILDWDADDVDPEAANVGAFIRFGPDDECKIECDVEWPA